MYVLHTPKDNDEMRISYVTNNNHFLLGEIKGKMSKLPVIIGMHYRVRVVS